MTLRQMVYLLDGGTCVACGVKHRPNAGTWAYQTHHCLKQQTLINHDCLLPLEQEAQLCVLLCKRCHEGHEQRHRVIPASKLPERVHLAVGRLGAWAPQALARYHREA
jgi:hypothetical protein